MKLISISVAISLLYLTSLSVVACSENQSKLDQAAAAKAIEPVAPAPDAKGVQATGDQRNLAVEHVRDADPKATCVVFYQRAGQFLTDSAECTASSGIKLYVSVDTVNGPVVKRVSPPSKEEMEAAAAQQQQGVTQPGPGPTKALAVTPTAKVKTGK